MINVFVKDVDDLTVLKNVIDVSISHDQNATITTVNDDVIEIKLFQDDVVIAQKYNLSDLARGIFKPLS